MQSAVFMERQPKVRWQLVNDGMVDVTLCLNERETVLENEGEEGTAATSPLPVDVSNTVTLTADKLTNGITSNDAKFTVQEGKISMACV